MKMPFVQVFAHPSHLIVRTTADNQSRTDVVPRVARDLYVKVSEAHSIVATVLDAEEMLKLTATEIVFDKVAPRCLKVTAVPLDAQHGGVALHKVQVETSGTCGPSLTDLSERGVLVFANSTLQVSQDNVLTKPLMACLSRVTRFKEYSTQELQTICRAAKPAAQGHDTLVIIDRALPALPLLKHFKLVTRGNQTLMYWKPRNQSSLETAWQEALQVWHAYQGARHRLPQLDL
jgi:hypothetical protein